MQPAASIIFKAIFELNAKFHTYIPNSKIRQAKFHNSTPGVEISPDSILDLHEANILESL